jgi:hypothetical protein
MSENLRDILPSVDTGPGLQRALRYSDFFVKQINIVKFGLNKPSLPNAPLSSILFNPRGIFSINVMVT